MTLKPARILPATTVVFALVLAGFGVLVASTVDLHAPKSFAWDLLALGMVYSLVVASVLGTFCAGNAIEASDALPDGRNVANAPTFDKAA